MLRLTRELVNSTTARELKAVMRGGEKSFAQGGGVGAVTGIELRKAVTLRQLGCKSFHPRVLGKLLLVFATVHLSLRKKAELSYYRESCRSTRPRRRSTGKQLAAP